MPSSSPSTASRWVRLAGWLLLLCCLPLRLGEPEEKPGRLSLQTRMQGARQIQAASASTRFGMLHVLTRTLSVCVRLLAVGCCRTPPLPPPPRPPTSAPLCLGHYADPDASLFDPARRYLYWHDASVLADKQHRRSITLVARRVERHPRRRTRTRSLLWHLRDRQGSRRRQ